MSLAVENLSVSLGGRAVVRDASFVCAAGELVALVGPNGAGKTSLLRALAGLVPSEGRVSLNAWAPSRPIGHSPSLEGGEDEPAPSASSLPPEEWNHAQDGGEGSNLGTAWDLRGLDPKARARAVAYLPQGHEAHWPLPARDIVALGRLPHGAGDPTRLSATDAAAVEEAMRLADVVALADRPVTRLSGGERARVAMARVLAVGAPLILADEPTAALDPRHQLDVMRVLRGAAQAGATVIAVTHDLGLAARFADRVLVMSEGGLVVAAEPDVALAPDVLRRVFGIEVYRADVAGEVILVPWT